MSITNYTELQTAVGNWLHRNDLTSRIPEFIALGEAKLNRKLRHRSMITRVELSPSTTVRTLALPTGWREFISFTNDLGEELEAVTFDELEELAYGRNQARPSYYAIQDQIYFDTVADDSYSYVARYYKSLDIATDTTNTVLTQHPDVYLYSALLEAAPYLKDDNRIMQWAQMLGQVIKDINHQESQSRRQLRTEFGGPSFNIIRGY